MEAIMTALFVLAATWLGALGVLRRAVPTYGDLDEDATWEYTAVLEELAGIRH